jgi:prepilin-type N-terminal cleavage/methylation domain-containing protein
MKKLSTRAFTLIETMVAISLLAIAIVPPMSLTAQSLTSAYYARDQVTAFNLAQEGLESVRAVRDAQVLAISQTANASGIDLFGPIPKNQDFIIDSRMQYSQANQPPTCTGACQPLQTDGTLYGYGFCGDGSCNTYFTRTMHACYIQPGTTYTCNSTPSDEMRVSATVSWPTAAGQIRTFTIYDNLYRWVKDGSASQ